MESQVCSSWLVLRLQVTHTLHRVLVFISSWAWVWKPPSNWALQSVVSLPSRQLQHVSPWLVSGTTYSLGAPVTLSLYLRRISFEGRVCCLENGWPASTQCHFFMLAQTCAHLGTCWFFFFIFFFFSFAHLLKLGSICSLPKKRTLRKKKYSNSKSSNKYRKML